MVRTLRAELGTEHGTSSVVAHRGAMLVKPVQVN
jgi:hypothetical protein